MTIKDNVVNIQNQVQAALDSVNRLPEEATLVCVSKMQSVDKAQEVYQAGIRHFAENRAEDLLEKKAEMTQDDVVWHFIGTLQSRKVKNVINEIDYFHALYRLRIANEIQKRAENAVKCFVEVNVSGEESKQGLMPDELEAFIKALKDYDKIQVVGLMTMAPIDADTEEQTRIFEDLAKLRNQIAEKNWDWAPCHELSMGMSRDYPQAIKAGSTFIRIGSDFFKD